jgi:hypothetical protein
MSNFKLYRVVYTFNNSKFGFNNSISVEALTPEQATEQAKKEVANCYGSQMFKRFSFKEPEFIRNCK